MFFVSLSGCALVPGGEALEPGSGGRRLNPSEWPLNFLSRGETAAISTETYPVQYYWICQVRYATLPEDVSEQALWKVNFLNFTKPTADLFDGDTKQMQGAAAIVYDDIGGWFLIVPVVDRIGGDSGITRDGIIFVRRSLYDAKLGDGMIRCKYKYPNPSGLQRNDQYLTSSMTLIGLRVQGGQTTNGAAMHVQSPK